MVAFAALALGACSGGGGNDAGDTRGPSDAGDVAMVTDIGPQDGPPEAGPACGSGLGPCNPVTNTGCATGQACQTSVNMDQTALVTSCGRAGTGGYGASCMSEDDCMETFTCLGDRGCMKLCCGLGDDETCRTGPGGRPGATCTAQIATRNGGPSGLWFCTLPMRCDWFAQDCAGGANCLPVRADGTTECQAAGTSTNGQPCGGSTGMNCARGYICIAAMPTAVCRQICDPTLAAGADAGTTPDGGVSRACPSGYRCGGVNDRPRNFGVCVPAM
jgi:hypothetical protein